MPIPAGLPESSLPDRATHIRYRVLGLIASLSVLTYLDRICISRVQGDIQHDLHLSDEGIGLVFSAFMVGYAVFEIPVGLLSDIYGARKVILRIVLWWSVFTALTGAVFNFWPHSKLTLYLPWGAITASWALLALVAVRFLFGCGEAGVYPTLANVVRKWFPPTEWGLAQGALFMSNRVGAALAPVIIGRLSFFVGWRLAFAILGVLGVCWAIVFARLFREEPAEHPKVSPSERELIGVRPSHASHAHLRLPWFAVLTSPTVWAMGLLYIFSVSFGWSFYATWQPRLLKDAYGMTFAQSELWIGLPYLFGAVGSMLGGRVSDRLLKRTQNLRWSRSLVGAAGTAGAGACFLLASVAETAPQTIALLCLAFFSSDVAMAPFWAAITDVSGRFTGTLAGMFNTLAVLGGSIFVAIIPKLIAHHAAWDQVLMIIGAAYLAATLLWLLVNAGRPLVKDAS